MKICIVMTSGFEEMEAIGCIAILKRSGLDVDMYSLNGEEEVAGKHGLFTSHLMDSKTLDPSKYDMLLIAGGSQWMELDASADFKSIITCFHDADKAIAAICAAPTILGRMGYLKGKNYTCFTSMNADFGGTYIDTRCVCDGNLITGRSAAATLEFALEIIAFAQGEAQRELIKAQIYY